MSFRINTNSVATNALYNLNQTGEGLAQSIQRLSTGLRINNGADDPAGLIISEKYKAQITGLGAAIQNSQNGVNFAKTADGALSEVSNLLNTARGLAVSASNSGTLSSSQLAADQSQLKAIVDSVNRISQNTAFGSKKLLDGSAGNSSTVSDPTKISTVTVGGKFNGAALSAGGDFQVNVTQIAKQASITGTAYAAATTNVAAGTFSINGVSFTTNASDTVQSTLDKINASTSSTGVAASYSGGKVVLTSTAYGSNAKVQLTDNSAIVGATATTTGQDALAQARVGATGTAVNFTGSLNGTDGLSLTDADGNTFKLTTAGNVAGGGTFSTVGQVTAGSTQFQIGSEVGQTASLSLGNFAASQLGTGVVTGANLSNLDLTTTQGASNAIQVIDQAISQITTARGQIGAFQSDTLESNIRSLGTAQQNLQSAESSIADTDVAAEYTSYTKLQILQQSGISVLAQANSAPQSVLKLLG